MAHRSWRNVNLFYWRRIKYVKKKKKKKRKSKAMKSSSKAE